MFNFIGVNFPMSKVQPRAVYSATVRQRLYEHDYGKIYLRDWDFKPREIKPGSLMKLTIQKKEFYGYVHDIETVQEAQKNFTVIGFIGASYVMRQASRKIYKNVSADQVIAEIAKKYKFAYKAVPHPRIYPQIAQAGMTDWELMVRLAHQCGYALRAENTEIHFHPLLFDFEELKQEAMKFSKADGGFKPLNPIYSFRSKISETLSYSLADKSATSVFGVNPLTNELFGYTSQSRGPITRTRSNQEFFDSHETHVVANDYETARFEAVAALNKSQFPYVADVEVYGSATLRPAMPVYLNNIGKDYTGFWTILGVEHEIIEESKNTQTYSCKIFVGTDSLGTIAANEQLKTPLSKPIRRIVSNSRNIRITPKTILKSPGIVVKPTTSLSLVDRVNRPNVSGISAANTTWQSTHGNLLLNRTYNTNYLSSYSKVRANALF